MSGRLRSPAGGRRRAHIGAAVLVAAVTTLAAPAPAPAAPALSAVALEHGAHLAQAVGDDCTALVVVLLMDRSISLRDTDPGRQRTAAATTLVWSLADASVPVTLTVGGFGERVGMRSFTDVVGQRAAIEAAIVEESRPDQRNTDFLLALLEAGDHFGSSTADCRTVVLFTDGEFDIDVVSDGVRQYTTETTVERINRDADALMCGPLPAHAVGSDGVAQQLRATGARLDVIDLRAGRRDTAQLAMSDRMIDRLVADPAAGDPCSVGGSRVPVSEPGELLATFFDSGQATAGRMPVSCDVLQQGLPAPAVSSVAARSANPDDVVAVLVAGASVATGSGGVTHALTAADRSQRGGLRVEAPSGLASCFARMESEVVLDGAPSLFTASPTALVRAVVARSGRSGDAAARIGADDGDVTVTATANGVTVPTSWDAGARTWNVTLTGPFPAPVTVVVQAVAGGVTLGATRAAIPVSAAPPLPGARWDGPSAIEGTGPRQGRVVFDTASLATGEICVRMEQPVVSGGDLAVVASLPDGDGGCSADGRIEVPVVLDVQQAGNAVITPAAEFTAEYRPAGADAAVVPIGGGEVAFTGLVVTKPADTARAVLTALLAALALSLLPLLALTALNRVKAGFPDGGDLRAVSVPLIAAGSTWRRSDDDLRLRDVRPVRSAGKARVEVVPGVELRRRVPWNPFGTPVGVARSHHGTLHAGHGARRSRRGVAVPLGFATLPLLHQHPDGATAHVVARSDTSPRELQLALDRALASWPPPEADSGGTRPGPPVVDLTTPRSTGAGSGAGSSAGSRTRPARPPGAWGA